MPPPWQPSSELTCLFAALATEQLLSFKLMHAIFQARRAPPFKYIVGHPGRGGVAHRPARHQRRPGHGAPSTQPLQQLAGDPSPPPAAAGKANCWPQGPRRRPPCGPHDDAPLVRACGHRAALFRCPLLPRQGDHGGGGRSGQHNSPAQSPWGTGVVAPGPLGGGGWGGAEGCDDSQLCPPSFLACGSARAPRAHGNQRTAARRAAPQH